MSSLIVPGSIALPKHGSQVFTTVDPDEARFRMTRLVAPHKLELRRAGPIALRQVAVKRDALTLFQVHYGADVRIEAEGCPPYYLVKIPVAGSGRIRSNGEEVATGSAAAAFLNPDRPLAFDYDADCAFAVLGIDAAALERRCAELLGDVGVPRSLDFRLALQLDGAAGQQWLRLAAYLRDEALNGGAFRADTPPLTFAPLQQMVMTTLLMVQGHAFSDRLLRPVSPAAPRSVVRAEAYMEANVHEPITPVEIAAAAGVSERALFRAFQDFRGETPMARLRTLRLERVRRELLAGEPGAISVTAIALDWGFTHLGHFGQAYRRRFGETPTETLRRGR